MTTLIVALNHRDAANRAKAEGIRRWTGITPDNYRKLLPPAVKRTDVLWTDITWKFPPTMQDAISQAIRAGEAA
jgi:hypothetical protein